jgi:hypothetical protein
MATWRCKYLHEKNLPKWFAGCSAQVLPGRLLLL